MRCIEPSWEEGYWRRPALGSISRIKRKTKFDIANKRGKKCVKNKTDLQWKKGTVRMVGRKKIIKIRGELYTGLSK